MDLGFIPTFSGHWDPEWIFLPLFAALAALDALRAGPKRALALAFSIPITLVALRMAPGTFLAETLSLQFSAPLGQAGVVVAVFALVYVLVYRMIAGSAGRGLFPLQAILAGASAAVLLSIFWLQTPALVSALRPSEWLGVVFGDRYGLWWLFGSYLLLGSVAL